MHAPHSLALRPRLESLWLDIRGTFPYVQQDVVNSGRASVLGPNSGTDPQSVFSQSQDQAHCADPIDRSAWEDIELESRVLKEPLPANQQVILDQSLCFGLLMNNLVPLSRLTIVAINTMRLAFT